MEDALIIYAVVFLLVNIPESRLTAVDLKDLRFLQGAQTTD